MSTTVPPYAPVRRHGGLRRGAAAYLTAAAAHLGSDRRLRESLNLQAPPADVPVHHRPVVLVHGWMARKTAWTRMIEMLHVRGLTDLHTATYNVAVCDVSAAAQRVADRVRIAADRHGCAVDVVAHSMGGIATLAAVLSDPSLPVASAVTLGSPYFGAKMATYARALPVGPLRAAAQMAPGSSMLAELRDGAAALSVPWTTLWSPTDELVPATSGRLPNPAVSVETPPVGHVEMLLSRTVADLIADRVHTLAARAA